MFTANPSPSSNASYHDDWPTMSARNGTICAQRGSDANTSAAACAAEVTPVGVGVPDGVPLGAGVGVACGMLSVAPGVPGIAVEPGPPVQAVPTTAATRIRP